MRCCARSPRRPRRKLIPFRHRSGSSNPRRRRSAPTACWAARHRVTLEPATRERCIHMQKLSLRKENIPMNLLSRFHIMKPTGIPGILLALLVGILAFPTSVAAKCPNVPDDLVCAELRYSFLPDRPAAGEEVTVIAYWIEQRTIQPVTDAQWLARRGKPAYLWLWDHEPSELESIAYVEGMEGKVKLPQVVIPLQWDAEKREYQGTFVPPRSGRWYFRLGTVVPDALRPTMEAESDYITNGATSRG